MQRIDSRFVRSARESVDDETVPMPFVFGPTSRNNIRSREVCHLRANQLSIDKQLHLDTSPRIRIAHHPTGNTLRHHDRFTPTMKSRRKRVQVNNDCNRPDKNRFKYGFRNQEIDETGHRIISVARSVETVPASAL